MCVTDTDAHVWALIHTHIHTKAQTYTKVQMHTIMTEGLQTCTHEQTYKCTHTYTCSTNTSITVSKRWWVSFGLMASINTSSLHSTRNIHNTQFTHPICSINIFIFIFLGSNKDLIQLYRERESFKSNRQGRQTDRQTDRQARWASMQIHDTDRQHADRQQTDRQTDRAGQLIESICL